MEIKLNSALFLLFNLYCLFIAHRLSTIQNSNKIAVIQDGVNIEEGDHNELMEKKEFYFNLQTKNHS